MTTPLEPAPVAPVVVATSKTSSGRWVNLLLGAAAIIAVGGVAFAIGRSTAPTENFAGGVIPDGGFITRPNGSFDPGTPGAGGPGGPGFVGVGGPTLEGTVTAIDADSITVTLDSGQEMTFDIDDTTTFHEATETDPSAVVVGDHVAVQSGGGRIDIGGDGNGNGNVTSPSLTAEDVTVRR